MKEPKNRHKIKETIVSFNSLQGRKVVDVMEMINAQNVNHYKDLVFHQGFRGNVEVIVERDETDSEFNGRIREYQRYVETLRLTEEKKKERELKAKLGEVERLRQEIDKLKGFTEEHRKSKLEKTLASKTSRLDDVA